MEIKLKLNHLVAPLISYPNIGTINKSKIKKILKIFRNFLKLFLGNKDIKIKTPRDIDKKIICFSINKIEYSVPIKE